MEFINTINNNSILIIPDNIKNKVLEYIDQNNILKNIKIMNFNELKKGLFFDYNNKTIDYIMTNYKINYSVAKNYINDLYYLDEVNSNNAKIKFLIDLKKDLEDNNLLIKDSLFLNLLKSKDYIYVYGFDYINKFNKYMLSKLENVTIIPKKDFDYKHQVYEFENINDEISYVVENIANLINNGVSLNKIYIANYSEEYYFSIHTIFKLFNIPYYIESQNSLYDTAFGKYFLNNLNKDITVLLEEMKEKFDITNNQVNNVCFNKLFNLLNTYYWCDDIKQKKDLITYEMMNTIIPTEHLKNEIRTTNILDNVFNDDEFVFLIGFNLGSIPILKKDEDYINDDIKPYYLETSSEYNKLIKEQYMKAFKNIKNLVITYKNNSNFNSYSKSFLIDNDYLKIVKKIYDISNYSDDLNKLNLAKKIDSLIKFNENNEELAILNNNYESLYNTYTNDFTGIDEKKLLNKINDNLAFSATNIKNYYECPFKFYLNSVLKINEYETTLAQFIGDIFHYVLENTMDIKEDKVDEYFMNYFNKYKDKIELTNKNTFFISHLQKELHFVVNTIKKQYGHSKHNVEKHELKLDYPINYKIKTKLTGKIDKVLMLDNNALIIDYKTYNQPFDRDLIDFGIEIQLPFYLYLLKSVMPNINVAGVYLQHILNLNSKYEPNKDLTKELENNLKLDGITFNNLSLISIFDDSYEKSEVIKGLKIKADGSVSKTKNIFDDDKMLLETTKNLINECISSVCNGNFKIYPIKIENKKDGCKYCDYKDICFVKNKDFNFQVIKKGDDNNE